MPIGRYYKGHGEEVMAKMKSRYGAEKGERVFYAKATKTKGKPKKKTSHASHNSHSRTGGMRVGMKGY
jgi:hypothetical protein